MSASRRDFLKKGGLLGLTGLAGALIGQNRINEIEGLSGMLSGDPNKFTLPVLPYGFEAMEPFIDKQTMEIHYTKHHQAYVDKLNGAEPGSLDMKVSDATKCKNIDEKTTALIRNNLGGHFNHSFFWPLLKANPEGKPNLPEGKLASEINLRFKSFDNFKKEFTDKATKIFGSGWCWLIVDQAKGFKITTTPNQDNPLMRVAAEQGNPVLALDVWEHAYYLKYQNKRADYINNWWNIVNWQKAEELFSKI